MKKKKTKYDRRRAVNCKLIRKSKSNRGYCKYEITVSEKDGTYHKEPAYGRDMQDAISRLLWRERTHKIERKINSTWVAAVMLLMLFYPAFLSNSQKQPLYLISSLAGITLLFGGLYVWYKYIEKVNE